MVSVSQVKSDTPSLEADQQHPNVRILPEFPKDFVPVLDFHGSLQGPDTQTVVTHERVGVQPPTNEVEEVNELAENDRLAPYALPPHLQEGTG